MKLNKNFKIFLATIFGLNVILVYLSIGYFEIKTPIQILKDNFIEDFFENKNDPHELKIQETIKEPFSKKISLISLKLPVYCKKYIILTTINVPTSDVKYLSDALYGWCLLVVGDSKTPKNWAYKNAFYLSVADQLILAEKYQVVKLIPFKSYLRKMVAYLFAIENGATHIYETDDDNAPLDGLLGFRYEHFKGLEQVENTECDHDENSKEESTKFINPYAYFGQPSLWPRGYPLEKISQSVNCMSNSPKYRIYEDSRVPLIQQGLVNGDPDVDAIYRLTRKNNELLNIEFDSNSPPLVLRKNQYAPTNSQNTFFHYDAFFTLILPLNVTFRECDILRSYISTRLLNEINGRVAFMAPNAFQIRNAHSYHSDYISEKRLYESLNRFVTDLDKWICKKETLQDCFLDCISMLIEKKHFNSVEYEFYKAWIQGLTSMNYKWPKMQKSATSPATQKTVYFQSIEQEHSSSANKNEKSLTVLTKQSSQQEYLEKYCDSKLEFHLKPCKFDKFLLITTATSVKEVEYVSKFVNIHFPYIIICTSEQNADQFLASIQQLSGITLLVSSTFKECINNAFKLGFKQQAFMIAKNLGQFYFWAINETTLTDTVSPLMDESSLDRSFYLIRRNVANGVKEIKFPNLINSTDMFCQFYRNNVESTLCNKLLSEVDKLIWHANDLASEYCENIDVSKIWIPEVHDGPRADLTATLAYLGQRPILAGYKLSSSPYPEAIKLGKIMQQISNAVSTNAFATLKDNMIRENFAYYKNDAEFKDVDFVICSFYPSLCEEFIPLNKTIIFNPTHRYNLARCTREKWEKLNKNLYTLRDKSKLILSSMSKYDAEYTGYFTGMFGYRLYAYGGYYAKNVEFNPIRSEILIGPTNTGSEINKFIQELRKYSADKSLDFKFNHIRELYSRYTLSQLANHRAIILFPYSVMSYSITDFYISKIPIFVPSSKIWKTINDRTIRYAPYCGKVPDIEPHNTTLHTYSPNEEEDNQEAYQYWVKYSDYYQWPYVTVYESVEDLFNKLASSNFTQISDNMKKFNVIREADLLDNWCKILKTKDKSATIPKTYEEALSYFETDKFQV